MDKKEIYNFTEEEKSIIDGLIISDGYYQKSNKCLGLSTSSFQFAEYVKNILPEYIWTKTGIKETKRLDTRTGKTYTIYRLITYGNKYFENERNRWYDVNGKKIIPNDIKINKKLLLLWYLGDGCLQQHYNKKRTDNIKLCTNSFSKNEIEEILLPQLKRFNAHLNVTERKQYVITIPRKNVDDFLNYIGEPPFSDYAHKWNVFPYKNKNIEKNGIKLTDDNLKKIIVSEYIKGETITSLSKKYNLDRSLVRYYCKREGVYNKGRDKQTYKINKETGEEWVINNLIQFCKERKICYTNMIQLCSGKIKKYKDYKIIKL